MSGGPCVCYACYAYSVLSWLCRQLEKSEFDFIPVNMCHGYSELDQAAEANEAVRALTSQVDELEQRLETREKEHIAYEETMTERFEGLEQLIKSQVGASKPRSFLSDNYCAGSGQKARSRSGEWQCGIHR
jgi:hypothetical protein